MIYVDNMKVLFGSMIMCHLLSDNFSKKGHEELLRMVDKIGVQRKWIQQEGTIYEHFDICLSKRRKALEFGAKEIHYGRPLAELLRRKKVQADE